MALLTVLLLVAVMSALAVAVLDDIRFSVRRGANARTVGQAQWYALGAEQLAQAQIARLAAANPSRTTLAGGWNGRPFVFPLEDGEIRARVRDGGNCFNLNSVVQGSLDTLTPRPQGRRQFVSLMQVLSVPRGEAEAIADALVDWIDTNDTRDGLGGEDDTYARTEPAYRTGGTLLAEVSELRALRGVTPDIYARLRPYACALPTNELSPININTLLERDAVLVTMLSDGRISPEAARRALAERPAGGWENGYAFFNSLVSDLPEGVGEIYDQVKVQTRYFALDAEVDYAGAEVVLSALIEQSGFGSTRLLARRWTADE